MPNPSSPPDPRRPSLLSIVRRGAAVPLAILLAMAPATVSHAQNRDSFGSILRIELDAFGADAGTITFSELARGSINPIFSPSAYGGAPDGVMVGFAGYFEGQSIGTPAACPPGAIPSGCVIGKPLAPLRLAANAPQVFITDDGSNPDSPSLSGSPRFNGPVSFVFDKDIAGIGLAGGYFDNINGTAIQAFDRQGNLLGGVLNLRTGMDYMALVTEDGTDRIAGVQFSIVGAEGAGFAVDNVSFAKSGQLNRQNIDGIKPMPDVLPNQASVPRQLQLMAPIEAAPTTP